MTTAPLPSASSRPPWAAAPCARLRRRPPTARRVAARRPRPGPCRARARRGRGSRRGRAYGRGAHPPLVAAAKPLLGRRRERQHVGPARAADQLHLAVFRADRQHHRLKRRVQVGADAGGHGGALARVGVERLEPRARARRRARRRPRRRPRRRAVSVDRQGDDEPAGHVQPRGAGRRVDQPELLAPAPGHHGV